MEYGEGLGWGTVAISEHTEDLSQYLAIHTVFALLKEVLLGFPTQARSPGMEQVDSRSFSDVEGKLTVLVLYGGESVKRGKVWASQDFVFSIGKIRNTARLCLERDNI